MSQRKTQSLASDGWVGYIKEIEEEILLKGVDTYKEWPVVLKTMIRGITDDSQEEYREAKEYFGDRLPELNDGSSIQQAHLLMQAEKNGIDLNSIKYVTEIGGGLCFMLKLCDQMLPNLEWYAIYDLEPVSKVQEYILETEPPKCNYKLITGMKEFQDLKFEEETANSHLLLSSCAFSEIPVSTRNILLVSNRFAFKKYAMRIQKVWDYVDNIEYLENNIPASWIGDCMFNGHSYAIKC